MKVELLKTLWEEYSRYTNWLKKQSLSDHTKRAYRSRINHFLVYLATADDDYGRVLESETVRTSAVRDYKKYLRQELDASAVSINSALTAIDHFLDHLGLGKPEVERAELPKPKSAALNQRELALLAGALEKLDSSKSRALVLLILHTGLKIGECAKLNIEDIYLGPEQASVNIVAARENRTRRLAVSDQLKEALTLWLADRQAKLGDSKETALFTNPQGNRISTAGMDLIIRKVGQSGGLELSAHILRQTCLANLLAAGSPVSLVAQIGGHKKTETTRRYLIKK